MAIPAHRRATGSGGRDQRATERKPHPLVSGPASLATPTDLRPAEV